MMERLKSWRAMVQENSVVFGVAVASIVLLGVSLGAWRGSRTSVQDHRIEAALFGYGQSVKMGEDVDAALAPIVQGRLLPLTVLRRTRSEVLIGVAPFDPDGEETQLLLEIEDGIVQAARYTRAIDGEAPPHAPPGRIYIPTPTRGRH
jgi:hypothetical protein